MNLKKLLFALFSLTLVLSLTCSAMPQAAPVLQAKAVTSGEIQEEIDELEEERKELQKEMASIAADLDANMSEIDRIAAEKSAIDQEIALLYQEVLLINEQIQAYGLLVAEKQEELDLAQAELDELTEKNKERIRAMEENGSLSYWSVLFRANDFSDLLDRLNMIQEIADSDRRRLEEMRVAQEEVAAAQTVLTEKKTELEGVRLELEEKQDLLAVKRVEAETKLIELQAKQEEFVALMEATEEEERLLMQEIAQKEKEYNDQKAKEDAAARPPAAVGGKPPATVTNGVTWLMPCSYIALTSPFGWRVHPVYGYPRHHDGVDLANAQGTPITASRAGTVTIAKYSSSAGYYVAVNHGDGFTSVYMHMTHYVVGVGDKVAAGQLLGYMGSTGVSTGPHLHYGISYQGVYQNPADYHNFR